MSYVSNRPESYDHPSQGWVAKYLFVIDHHLLFYQFLSGSHFIQAGGGKHFNAMLITNSTPCFAAIASRSIYQLFGHFPAVMIQIYARLRKYLCFLIQSCHSAISINP